MAFNEKFKNKTVHWQGLPSLVKESSPSKISHSLNSFKGGYTGHYIGEYCRGY